MIGFSTTPMSQGPLRMSQIQMAGSPDPKRWMFAALFFSRAEKMQDVDPATPNPVGTPGGCFFLRLGKNIGCAYDAARMPFRTPCGNPAGCLESGTP